MAFWGVGSNPTSTIIIFADFPHVELDKYSPRYTQEIKRLGYIDGSARTSGRPAIPPFQGGWSVVGLSLVNLLQLVKRTNTPLIPNGVVGRPWVFGSWVQVPHSPQ